MAVGTDQNISRKNCKQSGEMIMNTNVCSGRDVFCMGQYLWIQSHVPKLGETSWQGRMLIPIHGITNQHLPIETETESQPDLGKEVLLMQQ